MSEFDSTKWYDQAVAILAALGGVAGVGKLIELYQSSRRRNAEAEALEEQREEASQQEYRNQLYKDWQYRSAELRKIEEAYMLCERERLKQEAVVIDLKQKVQVLQFHVEDLQAEIADLKKKLMV